MKAVNSETSLASLAALAASFGREVGVGLEPGAVVAWADQIRPPLVAALARSRPNDIIVVATPTDTQARVLCDDLRAYGEGEIALFPAWETLPFERVSPAIETMGERMRLVARLRNDRTPLIIVAPIRALLQRLSPASLTFEPIVIRRGATLDVDALNATLVAWGYVREQLAEHRGEFAQRGSIVDIFGSTDDSPVRIELWGDDVERVTSFSVNDQRSTAELDEVIIYPARELLIDDAIVARAGSLATHEPWGREQWERITQRNGFDGMENWLAWLVDTERTLLDVLPERSALVVCDPAYLRSRGKELAREEREVAQALASTWSFEVSDTMPRLHVDVDSLLAQSSTPIALSVASPGLGDPSDGALNVVAARWGSPAATTEALAQRLSEYVQLDYRIVLAYDTIESATRIRNEISSLGVPAVLHATAVPAVLHATAVPAPSHTTAVPAPSHTTAHAPDFAPGAVHVVHDEVARFQVFEHHRRTAASRASSSDAAATGDFRFGCYEHSCIGQGESLVQVAHHDVHGTRGEIRCVGGCVRRRCHCGRMQHRRHCGRMQHRRHTERRDLVTNARRRLDGVVGQHDAVVELHVFR
ncbi:MAG: hypothetical protein ACKOJH_12675 [Actinomycetota bacterium]